MKYSHLSRDLCIESFSSSVLESPTNFVSQGSHINIIMSKNQEDKQHQRQAAEQRRPRTITPATDRNQSVVPLTPASDPRYPSQYQPYTTPNVSGYALTGGSSHQQSHPAVAPPTNAWGSGYPSQAQQYGSAFVSGYAPTGGRSDRLSPQTFDPRTLSLSIDPAQGRPHASPYSSGYAAPGGRSHPSSDLQYPPT